MIQRYVIAPLWWQDWTRGGDGKQKIYSATSCGRYHVWRHCFREWRWSTPDDGPDRYHTAMSRREAMAMCEGYHLCKISRDLRPV